LNQNLKQPKYCFLFLYFLANLSLNAQDKAISLDYSNIKLNQVLDSLQEITEYDFFYNKDWFTNRKNYSFKNASLVNVLDGLVEGTTYNYYILEKEKRIFILKNGLVYDQLPKSFYPTHKTEDSVLSTRTTKIVTPFFNEPSFASDENKPQPITVGKSIVGDTRAIYQVSGTALYQTTREPIANLVIQNKTTAKTSVSKDSGEFTLSMQFGLNKLVFSAMGVETTDQDVIVYNTGRFTVYLEESLEVLDEVIVEADAKSNILDSNTGKEEFSTDETKEIPLVLGERNVLQIAKALPGITSAGEGSGGINVRGGKTDQNLIVLDHTVIYNPSHFFGIFQALNPFITDKVAVYKADAPLKFGGRLSSVIDIKTKKVIPDEIGVEGSLGPVTANLALEIPIKKDTTALLIGGRGAYADYILANLDDENLKNSKASFYDGIIKLNHRISDDSDLNITAYNSGDRFSVTKDSLFKYYNTAASIVWNHKLSKNTIGQLNMNHSRYNLSIGFNDEGNRNFDLAYGINETVLGYDLRKDLSQKLNVNYGLASKYYQVNPGRISPGDANSDIKELQIQNERALESSLYVGAELKVSSKWQVNLGARLTNFTALGERNQRIYEENQPKNEGTVVDTLNYSNLESIKSYFGPEARFSFRYLIKPSFSLKASVNNSYQYVHTLSSNTTVSPIDTWKLSDLHIQPQKSVQAVIGLYKNLKEDEYQISLESYYKWMDNVLDFKTGAELFLNQNVETEVLQGKGKAYGVEFMLKKNRGDLNGWLSYTYSRSLYSFSSEFDEETINNGDFFPSNFDKPHDVSLIANYRLTRRFSFSMNFSYQTGRPVTFPVGTYRFNNADFVVFSERNKFRIPDYYRLDLGFNVEGNHKKKKLAHSFITFQVYNVLGRNNPYSVFFVTEDGEVKALQSSIFGIPIPSITYNFKF
jgi:hypothetical protein